MDVLTSIIAVLTTPIAKRKGITISAEDCEVWAEELTKYQNNYEKNKA